MSNHLKKEATVYGHVKWQIFFTVGLLLFVSVG